MGSEPDEEIRSIAYSAISRSIPPTSISPQRRKPAGGNGDGGAGLTYDNLSAAAGGFWPVRMIVEHAYRSSRPVLCSTRTGAVAPAPLATKCSW